MVSLAARKGSRTLWGLTLVGFLVGCLPEAAPYRCDLAGGDRACDGVAGSRCIEGSCASPVSTAVCPSGFAFSASAATPGRCAPRTADAAVDAPTPKDVSLADRPLEDAADVTALPDVPSPDHPDVAVLPDLPSLDRPDVALQPDVPAPTDTPTAMDVSTTVDRALPVDSPVADVSASDVPVTDVPRDAGPPTTETPPVSIAQVVGGFFHTCARLVDNRVWCWGSNEQGQLGIDASTRYVANPARVNLADVVDIAAGAFHTCALTLDGEMYCWGRNSELQLGVAGTEFAFAPVRVLDAPRRITTLALGSSHTCVVTAVGQVFCWGSNLDGAVGVTSSANGAVLPTLVPGVTARVVVAGDAFTCAGSGGTVWCWGRNQFGELGANPDRLARTSTPQVIASAVATGDSLDRLDAGGFAVCARGSQGVRCWGRTDLGAIPGAPAASALFTPSEVPHYRQAPPVLSYLNQCSVDATDALRCWGANDLGASGDGTVTRTVAPPTAALPFAVQRSGRRAIVGQGSAHSCAVDSTGVLRCWGARYFGQLGDGRLAVMPTPVEVPAWQGTAALAAGRAFTCARRSTSPEVSCAGLNNLGQLGGSSATSVPLPTTEPVPVTVPTDRWNGPPLRSITRVSAGLAHACAITATSGLFCWGYNAQGQVNPPSTAANVVFGALAPFAGISFQDVACGDAHSCAVSGGQLRCWGSNNRGESGQATSVVRATGVNVPGLADVAGAAAGGAFTCARTSTGRVECFGANELGQCGTGQASPPSISLVSERAAAISVGASEVTAGAQHACARVGGEVLCWGANHRGQLGAQAVDPRFNPRPTRVAGLGMAAEVRARAAFTCARVAGRVWCWGANHRGQLGDGTFTDRAAPTEVLIPRDEAAVEIVTGEEHACARMASGRVYCWGSNHLAQLGLSDPLWIPRAEQSAVRWLR